MERLSATALKNRIGATLNGVEFQGQRVVLERQGRPAAAIVSIEDLRLLEILEDRLDAEEIERILSDPDEGWLSAAEAERELGL